MSDPDSYQVRLAHSILDIDAGAWDACANPSSLPSNPFIAHGFLAALEESGSSTLETGWAPHHILVEDSAGRLMGTMPMYLKNNSYGEYVFDHAWADAFARAGGQYYPKFQVSVPFTPATGRRLLVRPDEKQEETQQMLLAAAVEVTRQSEVSSLHLTFMPKEQWEMAGELGLLQRTDQQFHWLNEGYQCFDDFLGALASRKRKNLKKERAGARETGIAIERLSGADIKEDHWDAFYSFYMDTGARKWGRPYLTREFFSLIGERMADQTLLVMCRRDGRYIAGALNFFGSDTLFGRNWGCVEDHRFLHFEACYYQAIDFAIERGLKRVEAGAQGAHKLARGYMPTATYSAHYIANPSFRDAIDRYLQSERHHVNQDIEILSTHSPFRQITDE